MDIKKADVVDESEPLSKALNYILSKGTPVFVTQGGKYFGLIDDRNISEGIKIADPSTVKCKTACIRTPSLSEDGDIPDRLNAFLGGHFKGLPVLERKTKKVIGMITRVELMKDLLHLGLLPKAKVLDVMSTPVFTVPYDSTVGEAKKAMRQNNVHILVATLNGKPAGIISTFDLVASVINPRERQSYQLITQVTRVDQMPISGFIRERMVSVQPDDSLDEAVRKMINLDISGLLVVKDHEAAGILTSTDIFRSVVEFFKRTSKVEVSGLTGPDELLLYPQVKDELNKVVDKYSEFMKIESVKVHFKKGKSVYSARANIKLKNDLISFSYEDYTIPLTMVWLVDEMEKLLSKKKSKLETGKKKGKRR